MDHCQCHESFGDCKILYDKKKRELILTILDILKFFSSLIQTQHFRNLGLKIKNMDKTVLIN